MTYQARPQHVEATTPSMAQAYASGIVGSSINPRASAVSNGQRYGMWHQSGEIVSNDGVGKVASAWQPCERPSIRRVRPVYDVT